MIPAAAVLDIAIGLALVYLTLAIIASHVGEWVSAVIKLRATTLRKGIEGLLKDVEQTDLCKRLYMHPLIDKLSPPGKNTPSYISGTAFATALTDVVSTGAKSVHEVRRAVDAMPDGSEVKQVLTALMNRGAGTLTQLHDELSHWFDDSMDRVSGWYKRRMQLVLLGIAFVVALAANADTIHMARALYSDPVLRESMVKTAQAAIDNQAKDGKGNVNYDQVNAKIQQGLPLPLGWEKSPFPRCTDLSAGCGCVLDIVWWFVGIFVTAVAVSFGAPYWFEILGKLISLRASGKKPSSEAPGGRPPAGGHTTS